MKLTSYTDYSLRALMHLATSGDKLVTIQEIADEQGIAKNHLTKVVHHLGLIGAIETVRGRRGGLRLAKKPEEIVIGRIVRSTEQDFRVAECFDRDNRNCIYAASCRLKTVLGRATVAFLDVLDNVTLAQIAEGLPAIDAPDPRLADADAPAAGVIPLAVACTPCKSVA